LKNVLWLASWYPNKLDKFDGDFIQRHAKAVAIYCKVHVIYVKKDESLPANKTSTENYGSGNLTEQVIYYNSPKTGIKLMDKFLSQQHYKKHFHNAVQEYIHTSGKPQLVHAHVAMKAGVIARWMKHKWHIPYIVTEHWTAYLKDADKRIDDYPFPFKKILKHVMEAASALTVVSEHLGRSVQEHFPEIGYSVIPNVVDTDIFYPVNRQPAETISFIHISNMNYQKNTEAILLALQLLKETTEFEMNLYGPVNMHLLELISEYELGSMVFVMGEVPQTEIAKALQQSDALVLYSRFETFGCVLIEANACAVPVIVSDLEVFHEIIQEGVNGIFVEKNDPAALAEKLKYFIAQKNNFAKVAIAATAADKYNFKKVGNRFIELYNKVTVNSK
jgi:glycosyltransferase involved in cell wall biosynthesis